MAPVGLRKGLFTVGALDNIDHNPSSTTAASSFNGTGISLFQFPTKTNPGEVRLPVSIPPSSECKQHLLPDNYAIVPAITLTATDVGVPMSPNSTIGSFQRCLTQAQSQQTKWVEHALTLLKKEELASDEALAWAA